MKKGIDLMLDLETMGTSANSVIVQIGACTFDTKIRKTFSVNVEIDSCLEHGLEIDGSTVYWWLIQSDQARRSLMKPPAVDLPKALTKFRSFAAGVSSIWSHASFDFPILLNAYKKTGIKPGFTGRIARDLRTLELLTGKRRPWLGGVKHTAVDDAVNQAKYVIEHYHGGSFK